MDTIGIYEARTRFSELVSQVEQGRRVVITRHGKPVAVLSPPGVGDVATVRDAIREIKESRVGRRLGADLRALIEEGRR